MELRVLNYFVATAQELNMTRAAQKLLVSQPALSRQIADLEDELGVKLFNRQPRHLTLTPAGQYLYEQAKEILTLASKTKSNLQSSAVISGDLTIAAGESFAMQRLMNIVSNIIRDYPTVKIHILSGDYEFAERRLDTGAVDFAVIIGNLPLDNYASLQLPEKDTWGVLMTKDDPLAKKSAITAEDLVGRNVLNSQQAENRKYFDSWFGNYKEQINIIGTVNLNFNGTLLVKNKAAIMLTLDKLANISDESNLTFRPITPMLKQPVTVIWKRETNKSPVADLFLNRLRVSIDDD
ncbi:LysR family transcriptional regulator [Lactobacillus crispatus]|jgi:transcriptional regulator|uniref:LysR substrate-binding domain-containing protein n=1 Tax=Lactobacillus crispatus TaxID=47770 RepID=UPI0001BAE287|nr:LysR family transcriptional regulator [Lactobacillus crispatus]EEX29118.1 transcriptional regulator, LysR family [Lactobacillus crispatus MV-3A-US]MCT7711654.1 LysR family transcriptional regulator [Lactobacillus crispatus]MCT7713708.1 LysR family transcriptional regulator [Lactobacillus crispatus]MCZ3570797.1 LysR family transcriptional regulator [Lactobacillus crispatus]MCZ3576785.1 LysR family transcriptional regulator [Lactobacillus crispatus]